MFRYAWLLAITSVTGCASLQDKFCNVIEPDSYVLVSVANCETMQVAFDYSAETDFSALGSYDWMSLPHTRSEDPGNQDDSQVYGWVTDAVNTKLAVQGFRPDREAPDFLVSYDVPVEMRGTMTLTMSHADSGEVLWRGTANDEAYRARSPEAWERRIRTAVDRLLGQFPPGDPDLLQSADENDAGNSRDPVD